MESGSELPAPGARETLFDEIGMDMMWQLWALYLPFSVLSLTGALSPGPLTTMAITEGARAGRWAGVRLALGHGLVEVPLVFAIAYGLGAWLQQPVVRGISGLVGALVLIWMGYGLVVGAWKGRLRLAAVGPASSTGPAEGLLRFGHVPRGVIMTLTNPYWSFWWATVGAGRISAVAALGFGPLADGTRLVCRCEVLVHIAQVPMIHYRVPCPT
jgi:threonine/homoserine/homoserine lactone efflux protein